MEQHQFGLREWADLCERKDATIAALQAQLEAHERAYQEGHPTPCTLGSYCPYCEIERRVAQLTQRTVELEAVNKHCEIIEERKAEAYKEVEIQLLAKANLQAELARVRALIKALPKVEGDWTVSCALAMTVDTDGIVRDISEVVAAIVQHRQGMEG